MAPIFAEALATIAIRAVKTLLPDTSEDKLEVLRLQIQAEAQKNDLLKAQMSVNDAEASNPNRTWITWRELLGYACAGSVVWAFIIRPVLAFFVAIAGGDVSRIPELEIAQLFKILMAMLGIGA